ncbi:MAG: Glycosyl transferase, family 4, conserved region [Candidatus Curtissbacteria bacterium GW2011_GWA1_41_11]|uniref:Glycosyl transferase, family 4, conserved region n=1 Tax=Candidatus Curtissbacteria bacterium GW2011_GWA1_41_11 TaxID=1618409 RepID=A0A0G0UAX0_9BACT|nr:MAG: Glycosyl transferase, family 4, conserved region [Candidatus Curtissbacteria bacterium GW2011_GWA1_41_11]
MNFLMPFVIALTSCLILTPITANLARKFHLVDDPKKREHPATIHKRITPRAGGVPIFLAFMLATILVIPFSKQLAGILIGGAILILIGVLDDKYDLPSSQKLLGQILAALIVVGSGIGIAFITNPLYFLGGAFEQVIRLDSTRYIFDFFGTHSLVVWADLFALFWIVWVINMVNFSAGVDGQMPGVALVALLVIFITSLRFFPADQNQLIVSQIALIGVGVTLGFLFFNFYPAKIFPGDSGSYFLGFLIAVSAILSGAKVGTAILVMAVPLIDGVFTVIRRLTSGTSPFLGDRKHLHHRLLELGWGQRRVALFYWLLCAILGAIALVLPTVEKLFAGVLVAIIIVGGLLWLNMSLPQRDQK